MSIQWIAFRTILMKEILRFSRIWVQTILPPAITTALYFIIFGELIGQRIGNMEGVSYIEFIVPGVILMSVLTNAYSNTVSSFFSTKFHGNIDELLVSPTANFTIIAGYVCGGVARGLVVGLVVTAVSMLFVDLKFTHPFITLMVVLLTSTLFSLTGFINAVYARHFDDISIIPTFVLTPLIYLGGVFYSVSLLPEFWQQVALINPILYMINTFRYGMLGISDISISLAFSIICSFIVLLTGFSLWLMKNGVGIRK
jgi:ABC-2 type transport system permease protein